MNILNFRFFLIFIIIMFSNGFSQQIEHMVPIGFNSPFLKSGQFISSMFFQNNSYKNESDNNSGFERNEYSLNFQTYLGLADNITLTTRINASPDQTVFKGLFNSGGNQNQNFKIHPEIILSYRPSNDIEIFGVIDYSNYKSSFTESSFYMTVPVGTDDMGNVIYEERKATVSARPDLTNTISNFKIGITYSGDLW